MKSRQHGFTLVELMVVIAIMAIIMAIGVPSMRTMINQDSIRKAVRDVMDGCHSARAQAILTGQTMELRFRPEDGSLSIGPSAGAGTTAESSGESKPAAAATAAFSATLSSQLSIDTWSVNFYEQLTNEVSAIRFFPNGTSDEFTTVIHSNSGEYRKVTLDVITGLPEMEVWR